MSRQLLDKLDREILKMISEDARVPFLEVARACGVSGAAIHQRIQKLTSLGILKGSQFIIDPEKIYAANNHHLLTIIHDKLQPLGLARSESIISFHSAINRQLAMMDLLPMDEEE